MNPAFRFGVWEFGVLGLGFWALSLLEELAGVLWVSQLGLNRGSEFLGLRGFRLKFFGFRACRV